MKFANSDIELFHSDRNNFLNMPAIEEKYKAKYVGEFTVKDKNGNWANTAVSVFWQPESHPRGSNYFGLYNSPYPGIAPGELKLMITNAISVTEQPWKATCDFIAKKAVYSAFRHDYQVFEDMIADGGPEYFRSGGGTGSIEFNIKDGELYIL